MRVTGSRFGTTEGESREERQPDQGTSFPQISSQVSNLPFAGSRHQTNPAMYRFMRSQESVNPGGGDSLLLGVGFGGASVRGSPHSLSQLNSTHYRKSWPPPLPCWGARERERASRHRVYPPQSVITQYIQDGASPRSELHEPRITGGSRLRRPSSRLADSNQASSALAPGLASRWAIAHTSPLLGEL